MTPIQLYLNSLNEALSRGDATEHTHRPALKALIEALHPQVTATNEPRRVACGAPDYIVREGVVPVGHIEAKDIGLDLDKAEKFDQIKRYREALPNLILTNYVEFRWYTNGECRQTVTLGEYKSEKVRAILAHFPDFNNLLSGFMVTPSEQYATPEDLAASLAKLAQLIRNTIVNTFGRNEESEILRGMRRAFAEVLLPGFEDPSRVDEFADMYAQTLTYGMFVSRCNHRGPGAEFIRQQAAREIPRTSPFLRKLFDTVTGTDLDDEPYVGYVDTLVLVLARSNMREILTHFGSKISQNDPVIHFYETFLAAYDPKVREERGVYYTPEPVVDYMIRAVDTLLREKFGCRDGLADTSTVSYKATDDNGRPITAESHRVLVLDPACGTGTFLSGIVNFLRDRFIAQNNAGMWPAYVRQHLLPRLFGFELLMAPYAVAHLKLGMQLGGMDLDEGIRENWKYNFADQERIGVYLTNTLDEAERQIPMILGPWSVITREAEAAASIKNEMPIMVVIGNPPYSGHSKNPSWRNVTEGGVTKKEPTFIGKLIQDYFSVNGVPLGERNSKWLRDDYVKFLRWGTWRILQSGGGILAFITNHGYLDNPTFRGMRYHLLKSYDELHILNLHGNSKKREAAPEGVKDENVFAIQQGVAIGLFIKIPGKKKNGEFGKIFHSDLWGRKSEKAAVLQKRTMRDPAVRELTPKEPYFHFYYYDTDLEPEYLAGTSLKDVFSEAVLGFQSHRDSFAISFTKPEIQQKIKAMVNDALTDEILIDRYQIRNTRDWELGEARKVLRKKNQSSLIIQCLYRPFDDRYCVLDESFMDFPRREIKRNIRNKANLCLNFVRQTKRDAWSHVMATKYATPAVFLEVKDGSTIAPLYLYEDTDDLLTNGHDEPQRRPNFKPEFIEAVSDKIGLTFTPEGTGDLETTWGPEDIFHFMYAIFHAPSYRERYAEFLRIDFPRLPLTSDRNLFRTLGQLGRKLIEYHTIESGVSCGPVTTTYPISGSNLVEKPHFVEDTTGESGRVYINDHQYFEHVPPAVWEYHVGGYQVCEKWLKDRKGRTLSYEDIAHYCCIVTAISETMRLMEEIDEAIPGWPLP